MLHIENLVKNFGKFTAVNNLSFSVESGSVFGFVGPNGAGKTTTMKIMSGLMKANSGSIEIDGVVVGRDYGLLKSKIGYMPDFFGVYDNLKVYEYMDFYAGTYYIPYNKRRELITNLLELVDLTDKSDVFVDLLSRGMKQRLCLARSLIHDPEILILDEPASGLDPRSRMEIKEIIKQLSDMGKTIIISSHILPELSQMCSEIGIINKGSVVVQGSVNDIMNRLSRDRRITVKVLDDAAGAVRVIEQNPLARNIHESVGEVDFGFTGSDEMLSSLLRELINNNVPVTTFYEHKGNLEEIFMLLTGDGGDMVDESNTKA